MAIELSFEWAGKIRIGDFENHISDSLKFLLNLTQKPRVAVLNTSPDDVFTSPTNPSTDGYFEIHGPSDATIHLYVTFTDQLGPYTFWTISCAGDRTPCGKALCIAATHAMAKWCDVLINDDNFPLHLPQPVTAAALEAAYRLPAASDSFHDQAEKFVQQLYPAGAGDEWGAG